MFSWGANSGGQLGVGDFIDRYKPVCIQGVTASILSGGGAQSVVAFVDKVYTCGQFGPGNCSPIFHSLDFNFEPILHISSGWDFSVVLTHTGHLVTWGSNTYGQIGRSETKFSSTPTVVSAPPIRSIAAGLRHVIAVSSHGELFVWGSNRRQQLGQTSRGSSGLNSLTEPSPVSIRSPDGSRVVSCSAGANNSAILTETGLVALWGDLTYFRRPRENDKNQHVITSQPLWLSGDDFGGERVVQLASGWDHLVALTAAGSVYTCGRSDLGQLGRQADSTCSTVAQLTVTRSSTSFDPTPRPVPFNDPDGETVIPVTVTAGSEHTLMLDANGRVWAWGWNEHGMCGTAKSEHLDKSISVPDCIRQPAIVEFPFPVHVRSIGTGYGHSFAAS
ncbi:unnamed protein product [Calicophoron daubneyi]|uniref:RCC1-like domain-containing protein n=1 Tax=Calicophoron daubneyi TaxID=300641 RepID=A0AAV2TU52_CALDB